MTFVGWLASLLLSANPYLTEGRLLYSQVRYEQAEQKLRLAKDVPSSSDEERREAFDLLARSIAAQGRKDEALRVYGELLTWDPHAPEPERESPRIRGLFKEAKESVYPAGWVKLTALPAPPGRIEVRVEDPWSSTASVSLFTGGPRPFSEQAMERSGHRARADVAAPAGHWYVVATDRDGKILARLGSPERPLGFTAVSPPLAHLPAGAPAPKPKWPSRVTLGVSLAAAVVGGALMISSARDYGAADRAEFASDTLALDHRSQQKAVWGGVLLGGAAAGGGLTLALW